jgi:tetratricopeptide (TPR) repeat protein
VAATERAIVLDSTAETGGSLVCRICDDLVHLTEHYLWWDSVPAAQRTARRLLAARPDAYQPLYYLAAAAARLGDSATAYASYRRLLSRDVIDRSKKLDLDLVLEEYDVIERDVRPLLGSSSREEWGNGFWIWFMALRNQGRLREATRFTTSGWVPGLPAMDVEPGAPSPMHQGILALETGDARAAARYFEKALPADLSVWSSGVQSRALAWHGTLRGMALAAAGDTAAVRSLADSVERWGQGSAYGRDRKAHHYLRGMLHAAAGRHEDAVREFRAAVHSPSLGFTRVNYEMARSLLQLDRAPEAVAILQSALRGAVDASNLYVSRTELHELLAESFDRAGARDSAAFHYRAVVRAWRHADPAFHGRRDRAGRWLARYANVTAPP